MPRKDIEGDIKGTALLLQRTPKFDKSKIANADNRTNYRFLSKYLVRHRKFIIQLAIGLLTASILQLIVPFLTQSIVDIGIKNKDLNFIYLILLGQLFVFLGKLVLGVLRNWLILHLSTRINISLISDFFIKLMDLPISYFDSRLTGDILQRIYDHGRIKKLLTTSTLSTLFSTTTFIVLSIVLFYYNASIFLIFLSGSMLYLVWISYFFKKRKQLDYHRFHELSGEQSKVIEIVGGMQEIKLFNAEKQKRWDWEDSQAKLFLLGKRSLKLEQNQSMGSSLINELTVILITVFSATLVIEGSITLGMMLAITYIVGQLNAPIQQLIAFFRDVQDAKIALERMGEIHNKKSEQSHDKELNGELEIPMDIELSEVTFTYPNSEMTVIKDLSVRIPANKVTAIVGVSGSGKTTLLKLLLGFYQPQSGVITYGKRNIDEYDVKKWRRACGVVMQEGYIFNDSIKNNIALGAEALDYDRLVWAAKKANIHEFIMDLPLGFETLTGNEGINISTGQKQRILIARVLYKDPGILLFDEATSALDANNERFIMENLSLIFRNKTAIVIAHRLSTVKNADQILVLKDGQIIEQGDHRSLIEIKGAYYGLVKNQLELA